jgi:hypothetical protein
MRARRYEESGSGAEGLADRDYREPGASEDDGSLRYRGFRDLWDADLIYQDSWLAEIFDQAAERVAVRESMRIEYWEKTCITGWDAEKEKHTECVLHRRGEDALQMAIRRNPGMQACMRFQTWTEEAFIHFRKEWDEVRQENIKTDRKKAAWTYDF